MGNETSSQARVQARNIVHKDSVLNYPHHKRGHQIHPTQHRRVEKRCEPNVYVDKYNHILNKNTLHYQKIKERAIYDNRQQYNNRVGHRWNSKNLTKYELNYVYQHFRGRCCRSSCNKMLDIAYITDYTVTTAIDPKKEWMIESFGMLCNSCQKTKGYVNLTG